MKIKLSFIFILLPVLFLFLFFSNSASALGVSPPIVNLGVINPNTDATANITLIQTKNSEEKELMANVSGRGSWYADYKTQISFEGKTSDYKITITPDEFAEGDYELSLEIAPSSKTADNVVSVISGVSIKIIFSVENPGKEREYACENWQLVENSENSNTLSFDIINNGTLEGAPENVIATIKQPETNYLNELNFNNTSIKLSPGDKIQYQMGIYEKMPKGEYNLNCSFTAVKNDFNYEGTAVYQDAKTESKKTPPPIAPVKQENNNNNNLIIFSTVLAIILLIALIIKFRRNAAKKNNQ